MAILEKEPLALSEITPYIKDLDEKKDLKAYLKKFSKLNPDQVKKLREEITALDNPKVRESHIVKIADLMPEDPEDLNKVFTEVSLSQEEAQAILSKVKEL